MIKQPAISLEIRSSHSPDIDFYSWSPNANADVYFLVEHWSCLDSKRRRPNWLLSSTALQLGMALIEYPAAAACGVSVLFLTLIVSLIGFRMFSFFAKMPFSKWCQFGCFVFIVGLSNLTVVGQQVDSELRTWVSANGKHKTQASLVGVEEKTLKLQLASGKVISVDVEKVSEDDQKFAKAWQEEQVKLAAAAAEEIANAEKKAARFQITDFLSIGEVDSGYTWGEKQTRRDPSGGTGTLAKAKHATEKANVTLTVVHQATPPNKRRQAAMAMFMGFRNSIQSRLGKIKSAQSSISSEPLNHFGLSVVDEDGTELFFECLLWHGEHCDVVVAGQALDQKRARELADVIMSLEEKVPNSDRINSPKPETEKAKPAVSDQPKD